MIAALALVACGDNTPVLGLDDVSVLFPLPSSLADDHVLALATPANGGPLLPEAVFDQIEVYAAHPSAERAYAAWRIVAARLDPCFPDLALLDDAPARCQPQLRLVAQPLIALADGRIGASDNAIHLLYVLSPAEFRELATRWVAVGTARTHDPTRPLGVHPELAAQGLDGAIATELRALVVAYAGPATFAKLTYVAGGNGTTWQYGGLHPEGGELVRSVIPDIGTSDPAGGTLQTTTVDAAGGFTISPSSPESAGLTVLGAARAEPHALAAAAQLSLDLDNQDVYHLDAADCSSCHIAGRARARSLARGMRVDDLAAYSNPAFDLALALPDAIRQAPQQQRGFGYNGADAVWSQRAIDDSAAIADAISTMVPAP